MTEKNINKIIVVDDEVVIALGLQERLTTMGYEVIDIAHTGEDAVEKARSLQPDLMLLDIMIPEKLDGIQVAETVKSELDIPVIFITAFSEDQIIERAKQAEPYSYIVKPFQDRELKAAIEVALYKKEMEQRLRESERLLNDVFNSIQDGISVLNTDLTIQSTNGVMKKWYAKNLPLEGKKCHSCYHDSDKPCDPCPTIRCIESGQTEREIIPGLSGSPVEWVEIFSYPMKDQRTNEVIGVVEFVRDITERIRIKEALKESELKHKALVHNIPGMVYRGYTDWSAEIISGSEEICGYTNKELNSEKESWLSIIHPDDKAKVSMKGSELAKRKQSIVQIYRIVTKGGDNRWVEDRKTSLFTEEGEFIGIDGIVVDINERKQAEEALRASEERLAAFMDSATDGFILFDSELNYIKMNKAGQEITGVDRKEVTGKNVLDIIPDFKETGRYNKFKKVMKAGVPLIMPALLPHPKFGGKHLNVKVFKVGDGLGVIFTDITDRKQAEEALQKVHFELEQRVKERTIELEVQKNSLEEINIAMKVLLKKREEDKIELQDNILSNVKTLIEPYVNKLKGYSLPQGQKTLINILESNLNEIVSPFARKLSSKLLNLTPSEIQVANLVKQGKTTKEMSGILNISGKTVGFHRENIRKKLGLKNRKINLRSHLLSLH